MDIQSEPPPHARGRHDDDDSRFPVGMRSRSPILDHIDDMDRSDKKETKKRVKKEKEEERDFEERPAGKKPFTEFVEDDEEPEKPKKSNTGGLVTTVIGIALVVLLIIGVNYIYNNFDDITRWLASPTVPEMIRPSAPAQPANTSQQTQPGPSQSLLTWLSNIFAPDKSGQKATANTTVPAVAVSQNPDAPVPAPVTPTNPDKPSDTTRPTVYEPIIKSVSDHGATVVWKTSEPCISEIHYKTDVGETRIIKVSTKPEVNHTISLTGLDSGQKYYIKLQCQDNAGIVNEPVERSFQTLLSAADTMAPQLVGQSAVSVDDSSATISWTTDEKAKSQVKYGPATGDEFPSMFTDKFSTGHSVFLGGLSPSTTYHFQLISRDASGNTMTKTSDDYVFKTEPDTGASPYISSRAPNFTLKNLKGEDVSLSQFRGKKVILNFWASWCTPCKIEIPHFQAVWDKYSGGDEVMLLTVAGSQSEEALIRSFISNGNYTFTVCLDPGEEAFNKYDLTSIPRTYFIDKGGVIRRIQQGMFTGAGELEFMLNSY
jgi:peroxiredoxin